MTSTMQLLKLILMMFGKPALSSHPAEKPEVFEKIFESMA